MPLPLHSRGRSSSKHTIGFHCIGTIRCLLLLRLLTFVVVVVVVLAATMVAVSIIEYLSGVIEASDPPGIKVRTYERYYASSHKITKK